MVDQWVSLNIVLADGTLQTIDGQSELMWALKGAGHNFGIVTSVTTKIYNIEHRDWAIETFVFSGDKVEKVYEVANDKLTKNGAQAVDVIHWSYWLNNPEADPQNVSIAHRTFGVPNLIISHSPSFSSISYRKGSSLSTALYRNRCAILGLSP